MTVEDFIFARTPDYDAEILKSALENDPWVNYVRKKFAYEEVLERVRWLSEHATLLET